MYIFNILEAVQWRWTIAQILEQPEALLHDVLYFGGLTGKIKRINDEQPPNG